MILHLNRKLRITKREKTLNENLRRRKARQKKDENNNVRSGVYEMHLLCFYIAFRSLQALSFVDASNVIFLLSVSTNVDAVCFSLKARCLCVERLFEFLTNILSTNTFDWDKNFPSFAIKIIALRRRIHWDFKLCCLTVIFNFWFHSSRCFFPSRNDEKKKVL